MTIKIVRGLEPIKIETVNGEAVASLDDLLNVLERNPDYREVLSPLLIASGAPDPSRIFPDWRRTAAAPSV